MQSSSGECAVAVAQKLFFCNRDAFSNWIFAVWTKKEKRKIYSWVMLRAKKQRLNHIIASNRLAPELVGAACCLEAKSLEGSEASRYANIRAIKRLWRVRCLNKKIGRQWKLFYWLRPCDLGLQFITQLWIWVNHFSERGQAPRAAEGRTCYRQLHRLRSLYRRSFKFFVILSRTSRFQLFVLLINKTRDSVCKKMIIFSVNFAVWKSVFISIFSN